MSGLLGLLNLGSSALAAQNAGVAISARNTANVNTEGYSRQSIEMSSLLGSPLVGGVRAGNAQRMADEMLAARERATDGNRGRFESLSEALLDMESEVAPSEGNMVQAIASLFGGLLDMASAPMEPGLRNQVALEADSVASKFASTAEAIKAARSQSDRRIISLAQEASELAERIAELNRAMTFDADPVLADKREGAARELAEIVGGQARVDPDGKMRFVVGGGTVLVDGDRAARVQTTPDTSREGFQRIDVVDGNRVIDATSSFDAGKIAGEVAFRDSASASALQQVDQLAFDLATGMNAVHRDHAGLDGTSGRDLFVEPTAVADAASTMAVTAAVKADPNALASRAVGAGPGDNSGVVALLELQDTLSAGGGAKTYVDEAIATLGNVGVAARGAQASAELETARTEMLAGLRDSVSGVSISEEAARLAEFQHASEASARFISTVNSMLENLIRTL